MEQIELENLEKAFVKFSEQKLAEKLTLKEIMQYAFILNEIREEISKKQI